MKQQLQELLTRDPSPSYQLCRRGALQPYELRQMLYLWVKPLSVVKDSTSSCRLYALNMAVLSQNTLLGA